MSFIRPSVRLCKYHRLCLKVLLLEASSTRGTKLSSYLSFQAAAGGGGGGGDGLHLEAVLLEAGGGRPGRRLGPGLFFRSDRGVLQGETSQGRVAAAAHVERHICAARETQVIKKEEIHSSIATLWP